MSLEKKTLAQDISLVGLVGSVGALAIVAAGFVGLDILNKEVDPGYIPKSEIRIQEEDNDNDFQYETVLEWQGRKYGVKDVNAEAVLIPYDQNQ